MVASRSRGSLLWTTGTTRAVTGLSRSCKKLTACHNRAHRHANLPRQNTEAGVECIGKGKARAPYEFGCKVSVATPATKPKGGQFVLHAKALHGNPFDGDTLGPVIAELEALTGVETRRTDVDKGYRGHNHKQKFRVWITGQVRRVTRPSRREMKRRAAVEPVIGHLKAEHRMDRNYLKGRHGDRANAVFAADGYNFALLMRWLRRLLRALIQALLASPLCPGYCSKSAYGRLYRVLEHHGTHYTQVVLRIIKTIPLISQAILLIR
jgi:IS5 family transposase